jgi:hypothetical protein
MDFAIEQVVRISLFKAVQVEQMDSLVRSRLMVIRTSFVLVNQTVLQPVKLAVIEIILFRVD